MTSETQNTQVVDQLKAFRTDVVANARKFGNQYAEFVEQSTDRAIDLERKLVGSTKQEWLTNLVEKQAEFTQEAAGAYTKAIRDLLK